MESSDRTSPTNCSHLEAPDGVQGGIAVVGIGNPLHKKDSSGLELVLQFQKSTKSGACTVNLELFTSHLPSIYNCHEALVVVDTVSNLDKDGSCIVEIDQPTLYGSGNLIKASHGVSWLEELKLMGSAPSLASKLIYFFGVPAELKDSSRFLESLSGTIDLIEKDRSGRLLREHLKS